LSKHVVPCGQGTARDPMQAILTVKLSQYMGDCIIKRMIINTEL